MVRLTTSDPDSPTMPALAKPSGGLGVSGFGGGGDIFAAALAAEVAAQDSDPAAPVLCLPPRPGKKPPQSQAGPEKLHPLFKATSEAPPLPSPTAQQPTSLVTSEAANVAQAPSDHPFLSGGSPKPPSSPSSAHPLLSSVPMAPPSDHPLLSGLPPLSSNSSYAARRAARAARARGHSRTVSELPPPSPAAASNGGSLLLGGAATSLSSVGALSGPPKPPPSRGSPTNSGSGSGSGAPAQPPLGTVHRVRGRGHRRVHSLPTHGAAAATTSGEIKSSASAKIDTLEELNRNLRERKKKYGDGHARVGLVHNLIGNYHFRRGEHSLAAGSYDDALSCFKSSCSSLPEYGSDLETSSSFSSLGSSSSGGNSSSGGGPLELRHQLDVAVALGNVGAVLWSTGRLSEAVESLEKSVAIRRRVRMLRTKQNRMAGRNNGNGNSPNASKSDEKARRAEEKEASELSGALYSLGLARSLRGDYDDALDALNQARNALQPPQQSSSQPTEAQDLAATLSGVDDESALSARLRSMDAASSLSSARRASVDVELARIEDARGKVHLLRGDAQSALECHLRALRSKTTGGLLPSYHASVLASQSNVAAARRALGQWDDAAAVLGEVLAAQKLALFRERDPSAKKRLEGDVEATTKALAEVQAEGRRTAKRRVRGASMGVMGSEFMAAIAEERENSVSDLAISVAPIPVRGLTRMESGSKDDWGVTSRRRR